jgi:hypothetical protein
MRAAEPVARAATGPVRRTAAKLAAPGLVGVKRAGKQVTAAPRVNARRPPEVAAVAPGRAVCRIRAKRDKEEDRGTPSRVSSTLRSSAAGVCLVHEAVWTRTG